MPNDELLNTGEAAAELKVSVFTVNRYARDGTLEVAHKLPGLRGANLYRAADVKALAEKRTAASAS